MSQYPRKSQAKVRLDDLIHRTSQSLDRHAASFWRLIGAVRSVSTLLAVADSPSRSHRVASERLVAACSLAAVQSGRWIRSPETWLPAGQSRWLQLRSLLDHLFANY